MNTKAPSKVDSPEYFEYLADHYHNRSALAREYGVQECVCRDLDAAANTLMRCVGLLRAKRKRVSV